MADDVMLDLRSPAELLPPEATAGVAVVSPERLDRAASVTMTDDVMLDLRSPAEPLPPEATAGVAVVFPEPVGSPGPADGIDAENIVLVVIWGVPDGVRLSAGVRDDDGCWSLSPLDLPDLTIAPAFGEGPGEIGDRELTITGIAMTDDGTLTGFTETVPLADYLTADGALEATYAADHRQAGSDRAAIALDLGPALWHGQAFDALVIRDLPAGARLSAGAYDPTIDGWVLRPQELDALAIIPPADQRTDFTLTLFGVALRAGHANAARVLTRLPVSLT
jgi:large repetitive protein